LFCIDVAHGHHILMQEMISWVRSNYDNEVRIIAGNVATGQGAYDLLKWGADIVKVGIGPGRGCTTRKNTGVGVPQVSALMDVRRVVGPDACIISDGGITCSGDVSKALLFANAVMIGSHIAGTSESPGHVFRGEDDVLYKVYGGSASAQSKTGNGQENKFVEGITITVPFRGKVKYILREIKEGVQSALSYSGVDNLDDFRSYAEFRIISNGSRKESKF
jgi:IMP dehydrogenase